MDRNKISHYFINTSAVSDMLNVIFLHLPSKMHSTPLTQPRLPFTCIIFCIKIHHQSWIHHQTPVTFTLVCIHTQNMTESSLCVSVPSEQYCSGKPDTKEQKGWIFIVENRRERHERCVGGKGLFANWTADYKRRRDDRKSDELKWAFRTEASTLHCAFCCSQEAVQLDLKDKE